MYMCFYALVIVNVFIFVSSATEVNNLDGIKSAVVHLRLHGGQNSILKSDEGSRRKRSAFTSTVNITDTVNSLRSYVGASDMNYLTYSSAVREEIANWTSHCDYDATIYGSIPTFVLFKVSSAPIDHDAVLKAAFNSSDFYYALRSVELRFIGAANSYCSSVRVDGQDVANVNLVAYGFSRTSNFNESLKQYSLGEACTTCLSGSYWCYQGLCRDDCSAGDSNCNCNSYCLNCANTDRATCRCQCLQGWTGSRCETRDSINTTTPSCTTTPRIPSTTTPLIPNTTTLLVPSTTTRISSTTNPRIPSTSTTTSTIGVARTTSSSLKNAAPRGKTMVHLSLYAIVYVFLRL